MVFAEKIELNSLDCYEGFMHLYMKCSKKLYITALMILRNTSDAEDAVQDTVILAMKGFNSLKNKDSFEAWMLKILINRCKRLKFLRFRFNVIDSSFNEAFENESSDDLITLKNALIKLPYKYRIVVTLKFFDDLTVKQISDMLKIPQGTIKSQLHRALKQLKDILKEV